MSETDRILNDICTYLRITAAAASRNIAAKVLDIQEKALVYSKMDGKTAQTKIASLTGIPQMTISDWVNEFVSAGLTSPPNEYFTAHKALFTLQEIGISIANLKRRGKSKQEKTSSTLDSTMTATSNQEESR